MIENMKPCPFCGKDDNLLHVHVNNVDRHHGSCYRCGVEGPFKDTLEEAIKFWNIRPLERDAS